MKSFALAVLFSVALLAQNNPPSGGGGGSGTVTQVQTTAPLSGGPITTSGTVSCPTCLVPNSALGTPASGELKNGTVNGGTFPGIFSCEILDNAICTSAVDASGNPSFLATAAGVALPINGGTTPLVMFIAGVYQNLNTNVTLTVPSTTAVQQWILALQDTTNANMVAADFEAMNTAPFYQYTAPTCPSPSPALSSTNPSFWYNLASNVSELCTSNAGSYSPVASMVIGTIYVDATPKVLQVLTEPYRLSPYVRFQNFGNGSNGVLTVTSGTTAINTHQQYQSVLVTGGTLAHTSLVGTLQNGVTFQSQSPVMIIVAGAVNVAGLGRTGGAGSTGAGVTGESLPGIGGAGGGGGGSGTVSAAGGAGSGHAVWIGQGTSGGGTAGLATPTAGGNGTLTSVPLPPFLGFSNECAGGGGGSGAGDATSAGGGGGNAGGSIFMKMPSLLASIGTTISAAGTNGSNGAGGNAGGGGGGGGGCVIINAVFFNVAAATVTVAGGSAGAGVGTGTAGGTGGAGVLQENRLW